MLGDDRQVGGHGAAQLEGGRIIVHEHRPNGVGEKAGSSADYFQENFFLVCHVCVEAALEHTYAFGNVLHGSAMVTLVGEQNRGD